jgi:HEAT repeat protein
MIRTFLLALSLSVIMCAQNWPAAPGAMSFQSARSVNRDDPDYQKGLRELDAHHWDRAIAAFQASAARKAASTDAALYWEAYAQEHSGDIAQALATIQSLQAQYATSAWIKDAEALQLEIHAQTGAPANPSVQSDDDLKLLAINSLMQSDSEKAVPILENLLKGNASVKVKERALFVLTQSSSPEAAKAIGEVARNSSDAALQRKAIHYMGLMGKAQARNELMSIYKSTPDAQLKRDILHSFMQSGSRDFLLDVAKAEQNPELRRDAIHQLALTGGEEQLRQLYESETSVENKKAIINALFLTGDASWLDQIARNEKDPALRIAAIKSMGLMGKRGPGEVLVSIYKSDSNPEVRAAVLNALFLQQNGKALVDLARAEKDPKWKQEIVQKMSLVHSKEVTDYMVEVLR